jgi:hypothetical protein
MLLCCLAHQGVAPPEAWVRAALASLYPRLRLARPQDYANLLWAVVHLGVVPRQHWMAR